MGFRFIVVLATLVGCISSAISKQYDQYKVLQVKPQDHQQRLQLSTLFKQGVEFWTDPLVDDTVEFLVNPRVVSNVTSSLHLHHIPYQVVIDDVQKEIEADQTELDNALLDPEGFSTLYRGHKRVKRGIFESLLGALFPFSRHRLERPPSSSFRDLRFAGRPRSPRKISENDLFNGPNVFFPDMDWHRYHRLPTIYAYLRRLERDYPDLVEIVDIGKSTEGRSLLLAKVGKKQKYDKPGIFIEGGIHAREWISPATVTFILRNLVENYDRNRDLMDFYDFYLLPVANPDGYEYSHTKDRMWRKTRSQNSVAGALFDSCVGVDLNRNFDIFWGGAGILQPKSGNQLACTETYSGPEPFSEPEARAIRDAVLELQDKLVMYLAFHSFGQKILYPWSHTAKPIADWQDLDRMGRIMSDAMLAKSGEFYRVGSAPDTQYLATGGSDDWAKGEVGVKWVFLLELPDRGRHGFLLPRRFIVPVAKTVMAGVRAAAVEASAGLV